MINIIKGWFFLIFGTEQKRRDKRISSCSDCDEKKTDSFFDLDYCGLCGCALEAKARVKNEKCEHPDGDKWNK